MTGDQQSEQGEVMGAHMLEGVKRKRVAWRVRVAQVGGLVVALVLVLVLVLHAAGLSLQGSWPWLGRAVDESPLTGITTLVDIQTNVFYGTITVNGTQQAITREVNQVALTRKMNVVTVSAPPFREITCRVPQVVEIFSKTLRGTYPNKKFNPCEDSYFVYLDMPVVGMYFTSHQLPSDLARSLPDLIAAQAADIDPHLRTVVPVGQHYANGETYQGVPLTEVAAEPLVAQVVLVPELSTFAQGGSGDFELYDANPFHSDQNFHIWSFSGVGVFQWRFTRMNGELVNTADTGIRAYISMTLQLTPDQHWQRDTNLIPTVSSLPLFLDHFSCNFYQLSNVIVDAPSNIADNFTHNSSSLEGCVIHAQPPYVATFVMRFGAWLAADAGAHSLAPSLPLASSAEVTAAGG